MPNTNAAVASPDRSARRNVACGLRLAFALSAVLLLLMQPAVSAPLTNVPQKLVQPDGVALECLASGDEHFNWLHDENGYVIIQDHSTGYYTYAVKVNGDLQPSKYIAGRVDPAAVGLIPDIKPSPARLRQMLAASRGFFSEAPPVAAPSTGTINNIVVFIRFKNESEFTDQVTLYGNMFNSTVSGANSMLNYFTEVSYNALNISTTLYPTPPGSTVVSYQDTVNTRGYYQPYDATTNPIGYQGGDNGTARRDREHMLLKNAVNAIASQVPTGLNLDGDGDGRVDNVCFIIDGSPTGWASLLWPHAWALYSQTAYINGKQVYTYNFQLQTSLLSSGVGVLCHEMMHSLGAPDLYHYSYDGMTTVGSWDIMEYNQNPPQHPGAYMKYRYGHWISSIPVISSPGVYTLNPLTSSTGNCYRIASPNSSTEYYVVEYRKRSGTFENSLPGSGLLVYRINTAEDGQGNSGGPPDEVYVYRPNGTCTVNGSYGSANYSSDVGRTAIDDTTNPAPFLSNCAAGALSISEVGSCGGTISFRLGDSTPPGDTYEPDNTCVEAKTIQSGVPQTHSIVPATDVDWVEFTLTTLSSVVIQTSGASGDTRMWLYSDCSGTLVEYDDDDGTGLFSLIDRLCGVDPLPAGTYYVKVDDYGNDSQIASYTLALTVNPLPVAPTSASNNGPICSGGCATLTATGGSGTTLRWLTGSCTGTSVGTGNDLVVCPTSTTTYYARWENTCGNSTCATTTVTVNAHAYGVRISDLSYSPVPPNPIRVWGKVTSESPVRISDGRAEITVVGLTASLGEYLVATGDWNGTVLTVNGGITRYALPAGTEMVYIPAGDFQMGNSGVGDDLYWDQQHDLCWEKPQHPVNLSAYYIGKYEVTRGEYRQFMNAGGYSNSAYWSSAGWSWKGSRTQPDYWAASQNWGSPPGSFTQTDSHPVVGVSYYEAEAFCNWAGGHLPTEAQWEKAARWTGTHPNVYPWGDASNVDKCNSCNDNLYLGYQTAPVGSYPSGASPYGCQDMAGNVWELCQDWYVTYPGCTCPRDYTGSYRVMRGGGWNLGMDSSDYHCACRYEVGPAGYSTYLGFRLAR